MAKTPPKKSVGKKTFSNADFKKSLDHYLSGAEYLKVIESK